jgi:hypothetical protein
MPASLHGTDLAALTVQFAYLETCWVRKCGKAKKRRCRV